MIAIPRHRVVQTLVIDVLRLPQFRDGSTAFEYQRWEGISGITQVSLVRCVHPFFVERHRSSRAKLMDPFPRWRAFRGAGVNAQGQYGIWFGHPDNLFKPCRLVALAEDDRVPHEEKY